MHTTSNNMMLVKKMVSDVEPPQGVKISDKKGVVLIQYEQNEPVFASPRRCRLLQPQTLNERLVNMGKKKIRRHNTWRIRLGMDERVFGPQGS